MGLAIKIKLEQQTLFAVVDFEDGGDAAVEEAVADVEKVVFAVDGDVGNEALGLIEFFGEKGILALKFVAFFFIVGEEADGADQAGKLADAGDGFLGVNEEVAWEARMGFVVGDAFDPLALEDLGLKNSAVIRTLQNLPDGFGMC